jgi:hypothetical protein
MNEKQIKTYANWDCDLDDYLQIGDVVDEEIYDHFLNVLPPAYWSSTLLQMGEPFSHGPEGATYCTLHKTEHGWEYAGHCYRGKREHVKI